MNKVMLPECKEKFDNIKEKLDNGKVEFKEIDTKLEIIKKEQMDMKLEIRDRFTDLKDCINEKIIEGCGKNNNNENEIKIKFKLSKNFKKLITAAGSLLIIIIGLLKGGFV